MVINVGSMADAERAARYADEADMLLDAGCAQADAVFAYVMERLRG